MIKVLNLLGVLLTVSTAWSFAQNTKFTVETAGDPNSPDAVYLAKDSQPFYSKGVAYGAVPIGGSFHFTPQVGDWFYGPWQQIPEKDFQLMAEMGINSFRTYSFWYWQVTTDLDAMRGLTQNSPINATGGQDPFDDRERFFKAMEDNGVYGILGIALNGGAIFNTNPDVAKSRWAHANFFLQTATKLASLYGDEPSVMGFCIANEQNQPPRNARADVWGYYYLMAQRIREALGDNEKIITMAFQDDRNLFNGTHTVDMSDAVIEEIADDGLTPTIGLKQATYDLRDALIGWDGGDDYSAVPVEMIISTIVDVWGLNIYSGMGGAMTTFDQNVFQKPYRKPLLVTEWGDSATINDPRDVKGPIEGNARLKEKDEAGRRAAAASINSDIEALNTGLAFCVGGTYFAWIDEWWKNDNYWENIPTSQREHLNQQIINWQEGDPVPSYQTDAEGKMEFTADNGQRVAYGYPQYTFIQDGTFSEEWPEEGWGLFSVSTVIRNPWDNPWNLSENQPWPVDNRTERPLLIDALMGREGSDYADKGYPWLEANYKELIEKEETEGWHYSFAGNWVYDYDENEFAYLATASGDTIYAFDEDSAEWGTLQGNLNNEWLYFTDSGWVYGEEEAWNFLQGAAGGIVYVIPSSSGPLTPLQ